MTRFDGTLVGNPNYYIFFTFILLRWTDKLVVTHSLPPYEGPGALL